MFNQISFGMKLNSAVKALHFLLSSVLTTYKEKIFCQNLVFIDKKRAVYKRNKIKSIL